MQIALGGAVSRSPLNLLYSNGIRRVQHELHLGERVLLLLRAPIDRIIFLKLSSCLEFYNVKYLKYGYCLAFLPYCNHASGGGKNLGIACSHTFIYSTL